MEYMHVFWLNIPCVWSTTPSKPHKLLCYTHPTKHISHRMRFNSLPMSATKPHSPLQVSGKLRSLFAWRTLAVIVTAVMLAKWTWVFLAPKEAALPTTSAWKKTADAEHLFGDVPVASAEQPSALGNIQLVGVFAHPTQGFAVLSVEGKQVGAGLGEMVSAGMRLVETKANYVMIEHGGTKSRVDLQPGKVAPGISNVPAQTSNPAPAAVTMPPINQMPPQLNQIPAEQRAAMQHELDHFRRMH